jgi:exodeoxyribonuclease-1
VSETFYWHDYETWGSDPVLDRPAQFAGVRTDADLNEIGEPLMLYCRPAADLLPHPEACLITGLTPQLAEQRGLPEPEFIARIHQELARPGPCGVGYNSIRFDDEVTRHTLYRNFFDPYSREWRQGNSRWDLIDVVRLAHALRPEGLHWPLREDGAPCFTLPELARANGLLHEAAHDALSDVRATIALARRLRERQPRLFAFALGLRDKRQAGEWLSLTRPRPVLHVSSRYPAVRGCIAPVLALARHPVNQNGVLVADLRSDPREWLDMAPAVLREALFTPLAELSPERIRPPLKTVHLNRSPMLAPMNTLDAAVARRWDIDVDRVQRHAGHLLGAVGMAEKLREVFTPVVSGERRDPELDLYGGFIPDADRPLLEAVREALPEALGSGAFPFQDKRLSTLLFRYRARNWPDTLAPAERQLWDLQRRRRILEGLPGGSLTLREYRTRIGALNQRYHQDPAALALLEALDRWGDRVAA